MRRTCETGELNNVQYRNGLTTTGISAIKASANQIIHYQWLRIQNKMEKTFCVLPAGKAIAIYQLSSCA